MDEATSRARACAIAREWIGTPYRHQGRIKRVAADCTFLAVVYEEAGLVPPIPIPSYSPQAHLNRAGQHYLNVVLRHAHEVECARPGDLVLYRFGRAFSHGAIVTEAGWPEIIHGDMAAGFVVAAIGDQGTLAPAERKCFSLW